MSRRSVVPAAMCCLAFTILAAPVRAQESAPAAAKAQETAAPAQAMALVQAAQQRAKKQHKPVLVMFHASWCGWCKRLEAVMGRPEFRKMFDDNYIQVNLDVLENKDKKATLENPGGVAYMQELGGAQSGLPYYAFLDEKGKKLADSNVMPAKNPGTPSGGSAVVVSQNQNIGYPGEPGEIDAFMILIQKTAPHWSEADREKLKAYLVANAPKPNAAH